MVNYTIETRNKVVDYIRGKKKPVLQTESQFLGKKKMQIKSATMKCILNDLRKDGLISIKKFNIGKSKFIEISWVDKKFGEIPWFDKNGSGLQVKSERKKSVVKRNK